MKKITDTIRIVRLLRNLSQENMAEDLKMSQQGYSKLERGERDIKFSKLDAIARILGLKVEDILSFDDKIIFNIHDNPNSNNGLVINHNQGKDGEESISEEIKAIKDKIVLLEIKLKNLNHS